MINQVTLVGRLTRDPELRVTTDGTPVSHVTLAVNRHFRNQNGEVDADFVQCTLWKKAAENTAQYCRKGALVGITGRLQTRQYDNKEGKRVYVTEVVTETIRFLSKPTQVQAQVQGKPQGLVQGQGQPQAQVQNYSQGQDQMYPRDLGQGQNHGPAQGQTHVQTFAESEITVRNGEPPVLKKELVVDLPF
ncbi:MAG: single-stranded DNA-binding protein [Neobacillus sp.]